jgi:MFS transporter, PAT family, beta-lactamase induction signal transducer AmpG
MNSNPRDHLSVASRLARWGEAITTLRVYTEPRVLYVLLLGFASGLPLLLTFSTLTFWLAEVGVDKSSIGLFALVGIAYGWKFLWSPVIDRLPLPPLTSWLGRRRGWLVALQLGLVLAILALGASDPGRHLALTASLAVLVAFLSASQDIVIDAYRVELLAEREQGAGAACIVMGYRIAMLLAGAGVLLLAEFAGWFWAYAAMAGAMLLCVLGTLIGPEPTVERAAGAATSLGGRVREAVVEPLAEFFSRNGTGLAIGILLFIMLYKLGDALLGTMSNPFYVELGFSKPEVASIVKIYGLAATLLGGFLGGVIVNGRGVVPALWICGIVQLLSNLIFVVQALVGHNLAMLTLTISVENLAGGMGTAAFVAYLSSLCNVRFTATQYALLSSFMAQARTTFAASAGFLVEAAGWVGFFMLTTAAAVPALMLLIWLQRREPARERAQADAVPAL